MNTTPWELLDQTIWWLQWGYEAMTAEASAKAAKRTKVKTGGKKGRKHF